MGHFIDYVTQGLLLFCAKFAEWIINNSVSHIISGISLFVNDCIFAVFAVAGLFIVKSPNGGII